MSITLGTGLAIAGAALSLGVAGISSAIGLKIAGVAAAGAVAEKKENFKNGLILQALPQTQTIYGFIIALLIIMGAGMVSGNPASLSTYEGLVYFGAGLAMAIVGLSAIAQGIVAASGVVACSKNKDAFVPSLVFSGQCETPAIFGFIISLMILVLGLAVL